MDDQHADFLNSFILAMLTTAFFLTVALGGIAVVRRNNRARIAALGQRRNVEEVAMEPLEQCRAITVVMPCGEVLLATPPDAVA